MIVTIDGPSGSGKGTLSRKIAAHYNLAFLDTGLIYRAVAEKVIEANLQSDDVDKIIEISRHLNGVNFEKEKLRSDDVAKMASKIAVIPQVREALLDFQRQYAKLPHGDKKGVVLDGRDTGTVVCPDADYKIYLTSAVEVRAERRQKELQNLGIKSIYSEVLSDMIARDQRDSTRDISPLRPAIDAYIIDTSLKNADEVFEKVIDYIDGR